MRLGEIPGVFYSAMMIVMMHMVRMRLILGLLLLVVGGAVGQTCDACGSSSTYEETLSRESGLWKRSISASGCPNHYSYCTGKDIRGCGGNFAEGTETKADVLDLALEIPAEPVLATTTEDLTCDMGAIGIALNGVQIYGGAVERHADGTCDLLDTSSDRGEWMGFDFCSGHTGGANGFNPYHYHFPPSCLLDQAGATETAHSPQVGWALDGFPVYGPRGVGGAELTSDDVDECSGVEGELPDVDGFKYRYYFTGATSDLFSLPSSPKPAARNYPFSFACYRGCTWADLVAERPRCGNGSPGTAAGYARAAVAGITDPYVPTAAIAHWGGDSMAATCAADPTPEPTPAGGACAATDAEAAMCAVAAGGTCTSAAACTSGDTFQANRCGADCGCCVPGPTPAPTPAEETCSATDAEAEMCAVAAGGTCTSTAACASVDTFQANRCGADCGCCVPAAAAPSPTPRPSAAPTVKPTPDPTPRPTAAPTVKPTPDPTPRPSAAPSVKPTPSPPTPRPSSPPSPRPTPKPTFSPSRRPFPLPTTSAPAPEPTEDPTCTAATDQQATACASRGGTCYEAQGNACAGAGGTFLPKLCGASCGCCIKVPTRMPVSFSSGDDGDSERRARTHLVVAGLSGVAATGAAAAAVWHRGRLCGASASKPVDAGDVALSDLGHDTHDLEFDDGDERSPFTPRESFDVSRGSSRGSRTLVSFDDGAVLSSV